MEILLQSLNITTYAFIVLLLSLGTTYIMIPKLIGLIKYKWFIDHPNKRSSHSYKTPNLGGITFYVSFVIGLYLIQFNGMTTFSFNMLAAVTILFIAGLKDDLVVLSVRSKVLAQLLAITLLLVNTDIPIENLYGFLGLTDMPYWLSLGFSYFAMLSIINAYNLIDGIDGLAAMLGVMVFAVFGLVFYSLSNYYYFLLALVPIGYLLAFLRYNLSKSKKIFMGDTGSMITGFLIGVLALRFLSLDGMQLQTLYIQPENLFLLTLGILFVLTTDTLRVMMIRLWNNKSIFKPDRNHVHHILIDTGLSHWTASLWITGCSIFVLLLFYMINLFFSSLMLWVVFFAVMLCTTGLIFYLNQKSRILKKGQVRLPKNPTNKWFFQIKLQRIAVHIFRLFF
jgi:UDP-N-acetylmuramyl pentapeptide phosphotransferase/UDP-N-acetylglucosamine-1-phosphate transferase